MLITGGLDAETLKGLREHFEAQRAYAKALHAGLDWLNNEGFDAVEEIKQEFMRNNVTQGATRERS